MPEAKEAPKPADAQTADAKPDGSGETKKPDGSQGPGGTDQNDSLDDASTEDLKRIVTELRGENAKWRGRTSTAEESAKKLETESTEMSARLKALEDANKTEAELQAEKLKELEGKATLADALTPYQEHIKAELDTAMEVIGALDEAKQKPITALLDAFGEADHLGRLKAIRAVQAAAGTSTTMTQGDESNPGEPGGGANEPSFADHVAWSPSGRKEAEMAGLIPKSDKK